MVIRIADIVSAADTGTQGSAVNAALVSALRTDEARVVVSFETIDSATSSFVNVAFVDLLGEFSFDQIKRRLHIIGSSQQINGMIRSRLSGEAAKLAA